VCDLQITVAALQKQIDDIAIELKQVLLMLTNNMKTLNDSVKDIKEELGQMKNNGRD
jgi:hypothetical protein